MLKQVVVVAVVVVVVEIESDNIVSKLLTF
jgi:hypothetical protein